MKTTAAWMFGLTILVAGCNKGGANDPGTAAGAAGETQTITSGPDVAEAKQVVEKFLAAAKQSDADGKLSMFTPSARGEWERVGTEYLMVNSSPDMHFVVGEGEVVADVAGQAAEAHVASRITDKDPATGEESIEEAVWWLTESNEGWRIRGLAMKVFENQPPLILDFEDLDGVFAKLQMLEGYEQVEPTVGEGAEGLWPTVEPSAEVASPQTNPIR